MRRTAVLAGTYRQFLDWCREHKVSPDSDLVFDVTSPSSLRGRSNVELVRIGTWYERRDLWEIEEQIAFLAALGLAT
jgi:hypothetical protein